MNERGPHNVSYSPFQSSLFLVGSLVYSRHQVSTHWLSFASIPFPQPVIVFLCLRNLVAKWYFHLSPFSFWLRRRFSSPEWQESARRWVTGSEVTVGCGWWRGASELSGWPVEPDRMITLQPLYSKLFTFPRQDTRLLQSDLTAPFPPAADLRALLEFRKGHPTGSHWALGLNLSSVILKVAFTQGDLSPLL